MPQYTKEQLLSLYKDLPEDLQDALYSEQSAQNIYQACVDNEITDSNKISEAAKNVGYVLLGLLTPDEFEKAIQNDLGIDSKLAKKISNEIKYSVFSPIKKTLEILYGVPLNFQKPRQPRINPTIPSPGPKPMPRANDSYREPIE